MSEFITTVLSNQYVQLVLSWIQFIGWGTVATIVIAIISKIRSMKKTINTEMLFKKDLSELSEKWNEATAKIAELERELKKAHEYNRLTNDAVIILLLTSRNVESRAKLQFATRVKELPAGSTVIETAESVIEQNTDDNKTDEQRDAVVNDIDVDETDKILKQLAGG